MYDFIVQWMNMGFLNQSNTKIKERNFSDSEKQDFFEVDTKEKPPTDRSESTITGRNKNYTN